MKLDELLEAVNKLKESEYWSVLEQLRDELLERLNNGLNASVREIPLVCEPNLGTIVMSRMAEMGGIKRFFDIIETYNDRFINAKEEKKMEELNARK